MNRKFSIALLISTYNWPEALELVLLSIRSQSEFPDEVIIADDGSSAATKDLIARFSHNFPIPIRHAWHEDQGFRKTLILNKAVKLAQADYIIETDGDIILHPKFVSDHRKAAVAGRFVQGSRAMLHKTESELITITKQVRFHAFSKGLYSRFNALRIPLLSRFFRPDPKSSFNVKGCNLAFWKKDYIRVNGYYNGFIGWGWEDYEFAARLINAGVMKRRLKMAAVSYHIYHPLHSRANFEPNEKIYNETIAEGLTYRTNGYAEA